MPDAPKQPPQPAAPQQAAPPGPPQITIDGRQFAAEKGQTIIQTARAHGISIPHFCWHSRLSVAGNCRICLVKVEKMPKLVIACATPVADGMVVETKSPEVIRARNAVMEFLLINHPLDCPICDEAGECKLQDYAYKHGTGASRFEFDKVRKPKRVTLGPRVTLDTERCIMCSRCIRFCDEIVKDPELTFIQRGDHVELTTYPGQELDNAYSMNTIDLCPVGALTSTDFRFKSRVWEMSSTDTICQGCSRGCNVNMWVRNNEILRLTPRQNPDVNDYWMCDDGRLNSWRHVNAETRVNGPMIRKDGNLDEVGWDEALAAVATELKTFKPDEIAAIGSPLATNEDNYALRKLLAGLGVTQVGSISHVVEGSGDTLLITDDKSPNRAGMTIALGVHDPESAGSLILERIRAGKIKLLYVLGEDVAAIPAFADVLPRLDVLIAHSSNMNETTLNADIILSSSTFAEANGTMVNVAGRLQRLRPSVTTMYHERSLDGFSMSRWDKFGAPNDRWARGTKYDARPSWSILTGVAAALGQKWKFAMAEDAFADMAARHPEFHGLSYQALGKTGVNIRGGGGKPGATAGQAHAPATAAKAGKTGPAR